MKKIILILFLLIARYNPVLSQTTGRQEIDSLKKQLTQLKDSARIDCLNLIAQTIPDAISGDHPNLALWSQKADSIYHYASFAYNEAMKIGYKKGIAHSLANMGNSEFARGIPLRIKKENDSVSVHEAEKYFLKAMTLAKEINNDDILGIAYYGLSDILFFKSKRQNLTIRGEYLKKAIYYFHKSGNELLEGEACTWLCEEYLRKGFYEEGIEYCKRSMELAQKVIVKTKTPEEKEYRNYLVQQSLEDMADLYKAAGDYETAMTYLRQARQFGIANATGWETENSMADVFRLNGQHDSALHYTKLIMKKTPKYDYEKWFHGTIYLFNKEYNKALPLLTEVLDSMNRKSSNGTLIAPLLLDLAKVYEGQKNYALAMKYAWQATNRAIKFGARPSVMNGYELLSKLHYRRGQNDSAYLYLLKFTTLKDSIQNKQFLWRLNNYKRAAEEGKKEGQIGILNRDNKIKEQQLKQEALIRNGLFAGFFGFVLTALFILRAILLKRKNEKLQRDQLENEMKIQQLDNEKKQAELHQQAVELEMQALRAQMNPHFIFNCLSSINRIILKNDSKTASDYLTRFSRLIRMVLINSQKPMIPLEDELQTLRLYLDMERLRFKDSFDYSITTTNAIDTSNIEVPPLLLQPFCENAVWHGLMQKDGHGHLTIELSMHDKVLHCIIADDGIGRNKAAELKSKSAEKEKSMGLKITSQRLALLNQEKHVETFYTIEDIVDENKNIAGTKVILKIGYKELMEFA